MGSFSLSRASNFIQMIDECNLVDLGAVGIRYTHLVQTTNWVLFSKKIGSSFGWSKLAILGFLEAYVENLCRVYFDHCPLLLRYGGCPSSRWDRPFRFEATWAIHRSFKHVVRKAWTENILTLTRGLNAVREDVITFNKLSLVVFLSRIISLIMWGVRSSFLSLLLNGSQSW